jgi:hypothetical protein
MKNKFSAEELGEAIEILSPVEGIEPIQDDILRTVEFELKRLSNHLDKEVDGFKKTPNINKQESLSKLNGLIDETSKDIQGAFEVLNTSIFSPESLISLKTIQEYSSLDSELTNLITEYNTEMLRLLENTKHHQCLISNRGTEFTEMCNERNRLQVSQVNMLRQIVLAKVAKSKYEAAMKTFEEQVKNQAQSRLLKEETIHDYTDQYTTLNQDRTEEYDQLTTIQLPKVLSDIRELQAFISSIDEDIDHKELELQRDVMQSIIDHLEQQFEQNLLALASVLYEQESIQEQYDILIQIKQTLNDLSAQAQFRTQQYELIANKKSRQESIQAARCDEADFKRKNTDTQSLLDILDRRLFEGETATSIAEARGIHCIYVI